MARILSRAALGGAVALVAAVPAACRRDRPMAFVPPERAVPYTTLRGDARELFPWVGEHVALLTPTAELDPETIRQLVALLDGAYAFLRDATGRAPEPLLPHDGRLTIAVEADTCGVGCGFLGHGGIELVLEHFDLVLDTLRASGALDLVPAYELGRNFWFYGDALEYRGDELTGTVSAGCARLAGLWAIEAEGCGLGPHQGAGGAEYLAALRGLADAFEASDAYTWESTLAAGKSVENELGLGASNLFASLLLRVERESGRADFPPRFLRAAAALPAAETTGEAVDNLVVPRARPPAATSATPSASGGASR